MGWVLLKAVTREFLAFIFRVIALFSFIVCIQIIFLFFAIPYYENDPSFNPTKAALVRGALLEPAVYTGCVSLITFFGWKIIKLEE